jgi:hypothetical protein
MSQAATSPDATAGGDVPEPLWAPLRAFFFETHTWLKPRALARGMGAVSPALDSLRGTQTAWRRALAHSHPPRRLDAMLLAGHLRGRLALLSREEWWRLGLCVCVLPSCGQIQRSLDGHFRRAVRQLLDEVALEGLDLNAGQWHTRPVFLAGPGAWRDPNSLAAGGVRAAMEQACPWPEPVRQRVQLRFEPEELTVPPSVRGLDITWLEIACRALWPQHPWLWS